MGTEEMEEVRIFKLTLISADNLPDVRMLGKMKVYAKVSVNGIEMCSPVDKAGETNPRWNCVLGYNIKDSYITRDVGHVGLEAVVELYCERTLGDRFIGEVRLPLKDLFDTGLTSADTLTYDVEGTTYGKLNIGYSFGNVFLAQKQKRLDWQEAIVKRAIGTITNLLLKAIWKWATGDDAEWIDHLFGPQHDD